MKDKLAKKAHFQAFIDNLVEECSIVDLPDGSKELECHIDVDMVLSQKPIKKKDHNNINTNRSIHNIRSLARNKYSDNYHLISQPRREKLIVNTDHKYPKNKQSNIGNIMYSIFG